MPKDDINYSFTENGIVYDFYDVFVPAENFRQPALWTWGNNAYGQLGDNTTTTRSTPVTIFSGGTTWKQIASSDHTTAIKTDGTLWVWGRNFAYQLGTNDTTNRNTPVTTFAGGNNWKQVSCSVGGIHTSAIKTDGTLWTWGRANRSGTNTGFGDKTIPVTTFIGGTNWKQVSCGYSHTAAIKTDGSLWTWGQGDKGQLGTNDGTDRLTPVTTFAGQNTWKQVSCGREHTSAIKTDGSLWVWGLGTSGQLGNFNSTNRSTPVTTFAGQNTWKQVSCGREHTSAIKTDGSLWNWGNNTYGQLGDNTTTTRNTPVTTFSGGTNWKQISCGEYHTTAIKTDGTLWSYGVGGDRLGINDSPFGQRNTPVTTFAGGNNWKSVSAGRSYTAAIKYSPDP